MNGYELYRQIRRIDGEAKVYFLSSYETYNEHASAPAKIRCIIKKPIRMADLVKHVRLEIASLTK